MSGTVLELTIVLFALIVCSMATIIVALVLRNNRGGRGVPGNPSLLVLGRAAHDQGTNWEPFIVPRDERDPADQYVTPDDLAQRVGDHLAVDHAGLPTAADWTSLVQRVETLERNIRRLRVRIASQFPYEVIGALIGTVVGGIVAAVIPSRLYSFPSITNVYVSNHLSTVQHQLAQDHWVLGGIVVAGLLVGLVLGFAAKYILGRTETIVVDEANEAIEVQQ